MILRPSRASLARCFAPAALSLLLACGGGEENDVPDEGAETAPVGTSQEPVAANPPAGGLMSPAQAVDRQIELWEDLVAELEKIDNEEAARAAVPRLSSIAVEANDITLNVDPSAPPGLGSADQARRLEAVRDRYAQELTRITQEAPGAVAVISEALNSANR